MRPSSLDAELDADHVARSVWEFVANLDLSPLYQKVRSVEGHAGRPAIDPALLLALWLLATLDGVGSARALERLTREHLAYQWMSGGVPVGYRTLSNFRIEAGPFLDQLLTSSLTALVAAGAASLAEISIDGRRIRAHASAPSFRSRAALEQLERDVKARVEGLRKEVEDDPAASSRRVLATRERAARERQAKVKAALEKMPEAEAAKEANSRRKRRNSGEDDDGETGGAATPATPAAPTPAAPTASTSTKGESGLSAATNEVAPVEGLEPAPPAPGPEPGKRGAVARVSTTDPEARVMKMADNGYRPAYNVQLATETKGSFIVGVYVTSVGADAGLLMPVLDVVEMAHGRQTERVLADGGFVNLQTVTDLGSRDRPIEVFMPPPRPRKAGVDRYEPKAGDSPEVAAWRRRMGTPEGAVVYGRRGQNSEWVNAGLANRGCNQFRVNGRERVHAVVMWQAIAHNFQRARALARAAGGV